MVKVENSEWKTVKLLQCQDGSDLVLCFAVRLPVAAAVIFVSVCPPATSPNSLLMTDQLVLVRSAVTQ